MSCSVVRDQLLGDLVLLCDVKSLGTASHLLKLIRLQRTSFSGEIYHGGLLCTWSDPGLNALRMRTPQNGISEGICLIVVVHSICISK